MRKTVPVYFKSGTIEPNDLVIIIEQIKSYLIDDDAKTEVRVSVTYKNEVINEYKGSDLENLVINNIYDPINIRITTSYNENIRASISFNNTYGELFGSASHITIEGDNTNKVDGLSAAIGQTVSRMTNKKHLWFYAKYICLYILLIQIFYKFYGESNKELYVQIIGMCTILIFIISPYIKNICYPNILFNFPGNIRERILSIRSGINRIILLILGIYITKLFELI